MEHRIIKEQRDSREPGHVLKINEKLKELQLLTTPEGKSGMAVKTLLEKDHNTRLETKGHHQKYNRLSV